MRLLLVCALLASPTTPPDLTVPQAALSAALECSGDLRARDPVLLVPGTTLIPREHYGWNIEPALIAAGWAVCGVTTPAHATGDLQVAAEYVVHAIRTLHARSGRKVAVVGGSQGGSLPRWALRFWPDTRAMVVDLVGLGATNHGGRGVAAYCIPDSAVPTDVGCAPALWQQLTGSAFVGALNAGPETVGGISYTSVYSDGDVVVTPGDAALRSGSGRIANVAVEDVCPGRVADHFAVTSFDPVAFALVVDALTHDGPADPARIDLSVCAQAGPPGVAPHVLASGAARALALVGARLAGSARVRSEPPLADYAR